MAKGDGIQYVGLNELTTWLGRTSRRVLQLVDEGVIPKAGRGKYPLKQAVAGMIGHLTKLSEGRGRTSELSEEKLLMARIDRRKRELEFAEAEGQLITLKHHEQAMAAAFDLVRKNIRNLPGSVAPRLVGLDDARDVLGVLAPAVDDALRAIVAEADRLSEEDSLPKDLPGRTALLKHGVTSLTDLLDLPDYEAVPGIGRATEQRIVAWIEEMTP